MDNESYTLLIDYAKAATMVRKIDDSDVIFTEGIEKTLTSYFRTARENRSEILKLLGEAYENNYAGFLK